MGRTVRRGLIAAALISLLGAPVANAQQYEDETGDLDLEVAVTIGVTLSGEGYVGDSVVYITLTSADGIEVDLGTIPTDIQGRFFGEIMLPDNLEPGEYTIAATGVTVQGATRVLSARVGAGQELTLAPTLDPETTTTTTALRVEVTTTSRAERGSGLAPLDAAELGQGSEEGPFERILLVRVLLAGLVALGGVWWWLYRAAKG